MGGAKMARREGNIHRPDDLYGQGWRPAELRYALLATHYRAPLEWGDDTLANARAAVQRLTTAVLALDAYSHEGPTDTTLEGLLTGARESFSAGLDDDLNVAAALAAMFDLVRELNRRMDERTLSTADARRAASALREMDTVLAVLDEPDALPAGAAELLDQRAAARAARDWAQSDRLRDDLAALGVVVEDTRDGQRWRLGAGGSDG
jgi:cysteinyl-tRNA synthetase